MFVSVEVHLGVSILAAQARLADLARGSSLFSAATAAYARGADAATTGSPGSGVITARLVSVQVCDLVRLDGSSGLAVRWEAIGPDGSLFPALDADVTLTPSNGGDTVLALRGVYRPARNGIAAGQDIEITRLDAASTVRSFIDGLAAYLTGTAGNGGSRDRSQLPSA